MANPVRCVKTLCLIGSAGVSGAAAAHEGHDHEVPSGLWPAHDAAVSAAVVAAAADRTASDQRITAWKRSDGSTGFSSLNEQIDRNVSAVLADVNTIAFDDEYVYIRTSGVPSHDIGLDDRPASITGDLDATYRIRLDPTEQAGEKTETGLSTIGVMVNGVAFYNQQDGFTWDPETNQLSQGGGGGGGGGGPEAGPDDGGGGPDAGPDDGPGGTPAGEADTTTVWNSNAISAQAFTVDAAGGHASPVFGETNDDGSDLGIYHYHATPSGLLGQIDPDNAGLQGSPVVGYAFDGYAVVGPYAWAEGGDGELTVTQMTSSYTPEDNRGEDGPRVEDFALGSFIEDFVYVEGSGNLNEFNMAFVRFDENGRAILAEEGDEDGDWAYFLTLDAIDILSGNATDVDGDFAFPYIVGPEYFGVVDSELLAADSFLTVPDDVTIAFAYVPEPATAALLAAGGVALMRRRGERPPAPTPS